MEWDTEDGLGVVSEIKERGIKLVGEEWSKEYVLERKDQKGVSNREKNGVREVQILLQSGGSVEHVLQIILSWVLVLFWNIGDDGEVSAPAGKVGDQTESSDNVGVSLCLVDDHHWAIVTRPCLMIKGLLEAGVADKDIWYTFKIEIHYFKV